ncbi:MAG: hypothetical protein H0X29_05985 [Parachlamydiaceae bacterium]|nr:hypothetical protein [Parachlamydiaceae bacterium]
MNNIIFIMITMLFSDVSINRLFANAAAQTFVVKDGGTRESFESGAV